MHSHLGNLCLECGFLLTFSSASLNSLHPVGLSASPSLHEFSYPSTALSRPQILWYPIPILLTFLCSLCKSSRFLRAETLGLLSGLRCTCGGERTRFWSAPNCCYFLLPLALETGDRLCQFDECLSTVAGIPLLVQVPAGTCVRCQEHNSLWFTFSRPAIVPQAYCWLWSARSGKSSILTTHGTEISSPRGNSRKPCFQPLLPAKLLPVLSVSSPLGGIQSFCKLVHVFSRNQRSHTKVYFISKIFLPTVSFLIILLSPWWGIPIYPTFTQPIEWAYVMEEGWRREGITC